MTEERKKYIAACHVLENQDSHNLTEINDARSFVEGWESHIRHRYQKPNQNFQERLKAIEKKHKTK